MKKLLATLLIVLLQVTLGCKPGWTHGSATGKCYKMFVSMKTYSHTRSFCVWNMEVNAYLAQPGPKEILDNSIVLVGGTRYLGDESWNKWTGKDVVGGNWAVNEPSTNRDCVVMDRATG
eukprot:6378768-Ditylum_brightwellii.AAC.1